MRTIYSVLKIVALTSSGEFIQTLGFFNYFIEGRFRTDSNSGINMGVLGKVETKMLRQLESFTRFTSEFVNRSGFWRRFSEPLSFFLYYLSIASIVAITPLFTMADGIKLELTLWCTISGVIFIFSLFLHRKYLLMQKGYNFRTSGKRKYVKFLDEMVMTFNRLSTWTVNNSDQLLRLNMFQIEKELSRVVRYWRSDLVIQSQIVRSI